jgi:ABC-type multidrug transport system fused ATPase/permease subunit
LIALLVARFEIFPEENPLILKASLNIFTIAVWLLLLLLFYNFFVVSHYLSVGTASFATQLFIYLSAYAASRQLHYSVLLGVLRAPMSFFDTTPIGRVINRFAKDVESIDSSLPSSFSSSFSTLTQVIITIVILLYGSWFAIFALIPLAIFFAFIQVFVCLYVFFSSYYDRTCN